VWPVKASLAKYLALATTGAYKDSQYRTLYFHKSGPSVDAENSRYLSAFARATAAFLQRHKVFPILVAMERLDARACTEFTAHLGGPSVPVFTSEKYDIFQLVSILRQSSLMVSSRYHAIVTTMPAMVASAGVTMDERIRNLMNERGHQHLLLTVDDPGLEPKLLDMMERLVAEADSVRDAVARTAVRNLKVMARMGKFLEEAVQRTYPEFPLRSGVFSWEEYLPPLSKNLLQLAERYDSSPAALAAVR